MDELEVKIELNPEVTRRFNQGVVELGEASERAARTFTKFGRALVFANAVEETERKGLRRYLDQHKVSETDRAIRAMYDHEWPMLSQWELDRLTEVIWTFTARRRFGRNVVTLTLVLLVLTLTIGWLS